MRSIPAFLVAFILTVVICGALMIGCGSGGGGGSTTGGSSNTLSSNTGSNNSAPCTADGALCSETVQCCNKSTGSVCRREPTTISLFNTPVLGDYICGKPLNNNSNCTPNFVACTKNVTNCCGYCAVDPNEVKLFAILAGLGDFNASGADGITKGYCVPGSGN
jgi:hypothetical protein